MKLFESDSKLLETEAQRRDQKDFCPRCYKDIEPGIEKCPNCFMDLRGVTRSSEPSRNPGRVILMLGIGILAYAYFFFDVSYNGYANLDLMSQRQNLMIGGAAVAIVGAVLSKRK